MTEDMEMLDANDPDFIEQLVEALRVKPGDTLQVVTPQFERTDGVEVATPTESLEKTRSMSRATLRELGCGAWDEPDENGTVLMLFPYQWYDKIPDGMELEGIFGDTVIFKRGETDDDYRFGCLSYGIRV